MQNFRDYCIFCFTRLTDVDREGRGEHIIPEFLYGSLVTKDLCIACNNVLGSRTDYLALEDIRIISAAFELHLPELHAKIRDRGSGRLVDDMDGSESAIRFKDGKPRVVPQAVSAARGPLKQPNGDLDMASFLMTFEPGNEKGKHGFFRRAGTKSIEHYSGIGIL